MNWIKKDFSNLTIAEQHLIPNPNYCLEESLHYKNFDDKYPVLYRKGLFVIRNNTNKIGLYKYTLYHQKNPFDFCQSSGSIETLKDVINRLS